MGIYLLKVNKRNTKTSCEVSSKLIINIPEWQHRSDLFLKNKHFCFDTQNPFNLVPKIYPKTNKVFLPVISQPPKDNVCKCYLDFLLNVKNDQNLSNIFCHNDHDVFYKHSQIIWRKKKWKHCKYNGRFPY